MKTNAAAGLAAILSLSGCCASLTCVSANANEGPDAYSFVAARLP